MRALKFALVGLGGAGASLAVTITARGGQIVGWYDVDAALRRGVDNAHGLGYEGYAGQGSINLPVSANSAAESILDADVIVVSTTADKHLDVAREVASTLGGGQLVVLQCGYIGGSKVFSDAVIAANPKAEFKVAELSNALHLAGKLNASTVVIRGHKRWLEIACRPEVAKAPATTALLEMFPEFSLTHKILESSMNNPNCIGHVPAYVGGAVLLDRELGDLTSGILQFDEARLGRINLIAASLEKERDLLIKAAGLTPLPTFELGLKAYPAGTRIFSGVPRFGPKLQRRFLHEDVPCALVPMETLGAVLGTATPVTSALIEIANILEAVDFRKNGRNSSVLSPEWLESQFSR